MQIIEHRLFTSAKEVFGSLCRDAPDGLVLVMVGPTQAGKSIVFNTILKDMVADRRNSPSSSIPIVRVQVESVSEGRVKTKWLSLQLLKELRHPVYMHIGDLDELEHYIPSRGRDEGALRTAVKSALIARRTDRVLLDEAHLLTRTKSSELRGSLLESLKSIAAIDRTLIVCGGYELAYRGLFDSSHFAGRTVVYDFGFYRNKPDDMVEWKNILARFSAQLPLADKELLLDRAEPMLMASNGSIGLLSKWLWACKVHARSGGNAISLKILQEHAPRVKEQESIATDNNQGQEALSTRSISVDSQRANKLERACKPEADETSGKHAEQKTNNRRRPFESRPRRVVINGIELWTSGG